MRGKKSWSFHPGAKQRGRGRAITTVATLLAHQEFLMLELDKLISFIINIFCLLNHIVLTNWSVLILCHVCPPCSRGLLNNTFLKLIAELDMVFWAMLMGFRNGPVRHRSHYCGYKERIQQISTDLARRWEECRGIENNQTSWIITNQLLVQKVAKKRATEHIIQ
ncbi:hypothetical protein Prudu_002220 [Prunus dulcis]|uniref:Uncharacterized protein n=1 Tax=Prunus dulcis TaxID=3755 RepID=A0A4Y1QQC2_PRUDU|nr:hypothetical protein Prudu_002220 [Prunus dulcis]